MTPQGLTHEEREEMLSVNGAKVVRVMNEEQLRDHLAVLINSLGFKTQTAMAAAMGCATQNLQEMISGSQRGGLGPRPIGKKQIARMNELDPDYELVPVIALIRKKKGKK